jgi:glutaconyl-CoA/methylmalonyl-CoA decarboxylase subunit gamma
MTVLPRTARERAAGRAARGLVPSPTVGRAQRYQVTVEGQPHEVTVELDAMGQPVRVRVDDAWHTVRLAADDVLMVSTAGVDGAQHAVHLAPGPRPTHAAVGGDVLAVDVRSAQEAALAAALASAGSRGGSGTIKAPMPGRVVQVLVAEGDAVEADAPLLIVEAMKMENEVRAPSAGVVRRVSVAVGDTVEAGQLLCEVAAADA